MSSGTQVDLDWAGVTEGQGGQAPAQVSAATGTPESARGVHYLSDEEILGITPMGADAAAEKSRTELDAKNASVGARHAEPLQPSRSGVAGGAAAESGVAGEMPQWMQTLAGDPQHGPEAQQLWQEHQSFRAAFSSPAEARAIKDLFPGGAQEAQTLKQAVQSVDRIDAAIFSGDARAQSEVVAELARANPAAFRSLFAEASKVLEGMGQASSPVATGTQQTSTRQTSVADQPPLPAVAGYGAPVPLTTHESQITNHDAGVANHQSPAISHQSPSFDPVAYSNFEWSTNDVVARDVRSTIGDTLARVLPEGVAEGAARRIGEDIFNEIHTALSTDRALSEQVGQALRAPVAAGQGWRFGAAEQQRVASLLAGRAKQLVPSVARRVIGEWTSSVLGTARSKAARQAAAASRVDIAAAGGSLDSMPLRAMSAREVNYASMSDDEILGLK